METEGFTKEHSMVAKGVATLFLLFHHVFNFNEESIKICLFSQEMHGNLMIYGKICLSIFTFISAYGITHQYMKVLGNKREQFREVVNITIRRFIKLEAACCFIYPIAVIYKRFVVHQGIRDVYSSVCGGGQQFRAIYMIIDMLGLANYFKTPMMNVTWWYLSLAILLIFALPAIFILYKKVRIFLFPLVLLLSFEPLIVVAVLGVTFAYERGFECLQNYVRKSKKRQGISVGVSLLLIYFSYTLVADSQSVDNVLAWGGLLYTYITMMYLSKIPIISTFLKLVGKYSMNIFMVHTFIYMYFYSEFIYSFKKDYLIYGMLLLISFGMAIILETMKKIVKYNVLVNKCIDKFTIKEGLFHAE